MKELAPKILTEEERINNARRAVENGRRARIETQARELDNHFRDMRRGKSE
jgi:hypothetical protein